ATIGGARALGIDAEVGSLEPGKSADLVLFAERAPSLLNVHDPYQALVYCASVRDVDEVWVAGEPVVSGGRLVGVDLAELVPPAPCVPAACWPAAPTAGPVAPGAGYMKPCPGTAASIG